jgi:GxxExxY protein
LEEVTHGIIGCAIQVHRRLGKGYPEVIYQRALELEMKVKGIGF